MYFVLAGPVVGYVLALLEGVGAAMSGMSPVGNAHRADLQFLWAFGFYCVTGIVAGCVKRPRIRLAVTAAAHLAIIVDAMRYSGEFFGGALEGAFICGFLAIPFGVAWFILIADAIFRRKQ